MKNLNNQKEDLLFISKYKDNYEKLLIESYKNTQLQLLDHITKYNKALVDKNEKQIKNELTIIGSYNSLINSINSSMKYLDKHN